MGDSYPKIRAAAVQAAPVFLDREATLEKACRLIREAGANGAQLAAFPECFIPAFPHWNSFLSPLEGRRFFLDLFKNSVEIPSPATETLCRAARDAGVVVVMGLNEKDPGTLGTLYNTQLVIGAEGRILGKHRKLMPTFGERLVHTGGDGSSLRTFPTSFGEVGALICGENTNSLARFALLAQGEKVHVASWPAFASPALEVMRQGIGIRIRYHAFEGKVFVVSSSGVFSQEMVDRIFTDRQPPPIAVNGGGYSAIVDPAGCYVAGPIEEGECIVYGDLDFEQIIEGKITHDVIGHYNRFDVFRLQVNRASHAPLQIVDEGGARREAERLDAGAAASLRQLLEDLRQAPTHARERALIHEVQHLLEGERDHLL